MPRKRATRGRPPADEGLIRGTMKRLLETGVAAPGVAREYIIEQFAGWKSDFLESFRIELRRFFDRLDPVEDLQRLLEGRKVELRASFRLLPAGKRRRGRSGPRASGGSDDE